MSHDQRTCTEASTRPSGYMRRGYWRGATYGVEVDSLVGALTAQSRKATFSLIPMNFMQDRIDIANRMGVERRLRRLVPESGRERRQFAHRCDRKFSLAGSAGSSLHFSSESVELACQRLVPLHGSAPAPVDWASRQLSPPPPMGPGQLLPTMFVAILVERFDP